MKIVINNLLLLGCFGFFCLLLLIFTIVNKIEHFFLVVLKVQIVASGCSDPPAKGKDCARSPGSIRVNGIERSVNRRGLNIVVYNLANGLFEKTVNFDTHSNRAAVKQMVNFIDQIKTNRLVMVASKDAWTMSMNSRAYSALVSSFRFAHS